MTFHESAPEKILTAEYTDFTNNFPDSEKFGCVLLYGEFREITGGL